ncbi:MAG: hypothetical protein ABI467_03130 [Kofleriaceae bacterium]
MATHLVKLPEDEARSLSTWTCSELARTLIRDGVVDETTSLQPRTRTSRNRPARPGNQPVVVEHEYIRKGALNLFAAFDTRSGRVIGVLRKRKRQVEFIELLEVIDRTAPSARVITNPRS